MDKERNKECGKRLRKSREEAHINKTKLAELVGVVPQHIYNIERGERTLTFQIACACASVLGVTPEYLLGESEYKSFEEELTVALGESYEAETKLKECLRVYMSDFLKYKPVAALCSEIRSEKGVISTKRSGFHHVIRDVQELSRNNLNVMCDYIVYDTPRGQKILNANEVEYLSEEILKFVEMRLSCLERNIRVESGWPQTPFSEPYSSNYLISLMNEMDNKKRGEE